MNELERRIKRSQKACAVLQNPVGAYETIESLKEEVGTLKNELAEYQRIYGSLEQGDYLRRTL